MNFELTDEQRLLRDSLAQFLARHHDLASRHEAAANGGWRPRIWRGLAQDLALFSATLGEAEGGFGGGPVEAMLISEEWGRSLVIEPYIEGIVVNTSLLRGGGPTADALRARIVAGEVLAVPALYEPAGRFDPAHVDCRASEHNGRILLNGSKALVVAAPFATHAIVSARVNESVSLFLVALSDAAVERQDCRLIDGRAASDLSFRGAPATPLVDDADALPRIELALDEGTAALCAEAVGVIEAMLRQTVDYTKQREQFGVPIASFQVLQHRMADMLALLERLRSMSLMATLSLGLPALERSRAVSAAKAFAAAALKSVGEGAIQLHGGIGTTQDVAVSHYFKRATVLQGQFGNAAWHLARMARCDSFRPGAGDSA